MNKLKHGISNARLATLLAAIAFSIFFSSALANVAIDEQVGDSPKHQSKTPLSTDRELINQLIEIQASLLSKRKEQERLNAELKSASDPLAEEINAELEILLADIEALETSFEQIAIGGIDLSVFGIEEKQFDWREELVTVVKPLLENLKGLTEKPRKIESLRRVINNKSEALSVSKDAISKIEQLIKDSKDSNLDKRLISTLEDWQYRSEEISREIQLAKFQLDNLEQRNMPWLDLLKDGITGFIEGRGLTLLILVVAIVSTLGVMRTILWLIRKRVSKSRDKSDKTHYRLAAYGYRLLTAIMIVVTVLIVLYLRQDVLLLAISFVVLFGLALALKNLLPKYITESRILLNMGSIRENERVIHKGVPWKVSSLNVHSYFSNPEIRGVIRMPIGQMHEMISRPNNGDKWFPSSEGDWILGTDGNPEEVVRQSVDLVELRDLNFITYTVPTADYYAAGYPNITRAGSFRITITFGIDYSTQNIDPTKIEEAFVVGLKRAFEGSQFEDELKSVDADFESAGESSLNYLMLATFDSKAARFCNRIKRKISRACVQVCSEEGWTIPFPQLTIHTSGGSKES